MIKRMGKFDWCAVIEKQWCNLWKRQNVLLLHLGLMKSCHFLKARKLETENVQSKPGFEHSISNTFVMHFKCIGLQTLGGL